MGPGGAYWPARRESVTGDLTATRDRSGRGQAPPISATDGDEMGSATLRGWFPTDDGLSDQDWTLRHRLLTLLLPICIAALTLFSIARDGLDAVWLLTITLILRACWVRCCCARADCRRSSSPPG
jgi:hypothetical protein